MSAATQIARQMVESWPKSFREAVLAELLRDRAADPKPESPLAPVLSEERRAAVAKAIATPSDTFEMGQFLGDLSREDRD